MTGAKVIVMDNPTPYATWSAKGKARSPENHYPVMSWDELDGLGGLVNEVAAPDCALFYWVTWPNLFLSGAIPTRWGWQYSTGGFVWAKTNRKTCANMFFNDITSDSHWFMGNGYTTRANTEPCLYFRRGNPQQKSKSVRQLIVSPVGRHSAKPDKFYTSIERLFDGPYIELFARKPRPGWVTLGNEIDGLDIRVALTALIERMNTDEPINR